MADERTTDQTPDLRKGIVIFVALLAIIVGTGVYLWRQAEILDAQYDSVEQAF